VPDLRDGRDVHAHLAVPPRGAARADRARGAPVGLSEQRVEEIRSLLARVEWQVNYADVWRLRRALRDLLEDYERVRPRQIELREVAGAWSELA
jgi:hypothetical protein